LKKAERHLRSLVKHDKRIERALTGIMRKETFPNSRLYRRLEKSLNDMQNVRTTEDRKLLHKIIRMTKSISSMTSRATTEHRRSRTTL